MGQQQLLLVILVTIIVGIATVVAINIFGTSATQANEDAVRQDLVQIGTSAQGWYIRPELLGGGGNSFVGIDFNKISFPGTIGTQDDGSGGSEPNVLVSSNLNGTYIIQSGASATEFTVRGFPSSAPNYTQGEANGTNFFEVRVGQGAMTVSPTIGEAAPAL